MIRHSLPVGLALALGASLISGCGSDSDPAKGGRTLRFKLTDAGCDPARAKVPAGHVTFDVRNDGADSVTELELLDGDKVLGETENLSDGLSGSFSVTLERGTYTLYCPGGDTERGTLTVTGSGKAASSPQADAAVER
jgi:iron uptake system component EfeO